MLGAKGGRGEPSSLPNTAAPSVPATSRIRKFFLNGGLLLRVQPGGYLDELLKSPSLIFCPIGCPIYILMLAAADGLPGPVEYLCIEDPMFICVYDDSINPSP